MPIAYIGLGANLPGTTGSPEATLAAATVRLAECGRLIGCSSLYSTAPVGLADQPRFLNAVIQMETALSPRELLEGLLDIEREFGRDRTDGIRNGPRALDLDILLFGDFVLSEYDLRIPHPCLAGRAFVLVPLHEIDPEARDPQTGSSVAQYLQNLFLEPEGANDAVVHVESSLWRAGPCGAGKNAPDSGRGGSSANPDHS